MAINRIRGSTGAFYTRISFGNKTNHQYRNGYYGITIRHRYSGYDPYAPGRCRVVVTGMGAVTPIGNTLEESWNNLVGASKTTDDNNKNNISRNCGITSLEEALHHQNLSPEQFDAEWKIAKTLPCQVAAPVKTLLDYDTKRTARFVQMAIVAGAEAMRRSKLDEWLKLIDSVVEDRPRNDVYRSWVGVSVGSGMSGVREITQSWDIVTATKDSSARKLSPHFIPKVLTNSAAGRLSIEHGLQGPNLAPSTACAAGSHAIGDAFRAIQYGQVKVMLAGATESSIEPLGLAGFCRLRALSTGFNDTPEQSSRPFDAARDGFVMGEGAAILVLEELEHAVSRGAPILAELCGYGASGDAFHITAPNENGRGAAFAMHLAKEDAGWRTWSTIDEKRIHVGYVNAHATSTPKGDEIEAMVIDRALKLAAGDTDEMDRPKAYVSSTKGATGHLLGAAGALEAAFTVMSLVQQQLPPTLNLHNLDTGASADNLESPPLSFDHIPNNAIQPSSDIKAAMSNSFGFGGTNASLLFCKYYENDES